MKYLKSFKFWLISVALLYTTIGFVFVPWFLTNKTPALLKEKLGIHVEIGKAKFNPYSFNLEINDILLKDLKNKPVIGFKKIFVDYMPIGLLEGTIFFGSLTIDSPKLYATVEKDGKLNFENIVPPNNQKTTKNNEEKSSNNLPAIALQKLKITNGNIKFSDLRDEKEFNLNFGPYNFNAHDISTKKDALNAHNFITKINKDGELFWEGGVRLNPLKLYGEINVKNLKLPSLYSYALSDFDASLDNGSLDFKIPYKIDLSKDLKLTINDAQAKITNLMLLNKRTNNNITQIPQIEVKGFNFIWPDKKIEIEKLNIDNPDIFTLLTKDKELTIVKAFTHNVKQDTNTTENSTPNEWSFLLKDAYLNNAKLTFVDNMGNEPIQTALTKTSVHVKNISLDETIPIGFMIDTKLNTNTNVISSGKIITKPFSLSADMELQNFDTLDYLAYIKPYINFKIQNAKLNTKTHIEIDLENELKMNVLSDATINNLLFKTKNDKKFLSWKQLNLNKVAFSWPEQKVLIEKLDIDTLYVYANLDKNAELSLVKAFTPKQKNSTVSEKKSVSKPWNFLLKETTLSNTNLTFVDSMGKEAVKTDLTKTSLHVKNISLDGKTPIGFDLITKVNKTGKLKSTGKILTKPFKISSDIELKNFNVTDYSAYAKPYIDFKITNTTLDSKTHIEVTYKKRLNMNIRSDASIKNLSFKTNDNQRFLEWKSLDLKKINYKHDPMELSIKSLNLDEPFIKLHIDEKGGTNFSGLIKESKKTKKVTKKEKQKPMNIKIGPMKLTNGTSDFSDFSLPFPFKTHIHKLKGDLTTVDIQTTTPTKLSLTGQIDKYGYADIQGVLLPFNISEQAMLNVLFKNISLTSLTPYSSKFVGYKIEKGKLSMDLKYAIEKSALIGDNKINIDTLELGEIVDSPDATSLPLELAIALLKDSDGQIDIDMPVQGNMNAPDFSYGGVVWGAVGNMITGIVTAPFRMLGNMLGIDGDELKFIDFDKGSALIISTEQEKLENIHKILTKRPNIKIEITGGFDDIYDVQKLQEEKFVAIIKKELALKEDSNSTNAYGDILKDMYTKEFSKTEYTELEKSFEIVERSDDNKTIVKKDPPEIDVISFNKKMQEKISSNIEISTETLKQLASKRANAIKNELTQKYKVSPEKIRVVDPKLQEAKRDRWIETILDISI